MTPEEIEEYRQDLFYLYNEYDTALSNIIYNRIIENNQD